MVNKLLSELAKGTWSSATSYTIGDIVDYDGSSYICISNNSNQTPPNATYWALLASRGDNQFTSEQALDLTDGGNSTLHRHDSDRDRSNHTGVQTASTISDFHTEVSSNSDVSENTTARHSHLNKLLLDTYTQTDADILDAITKKHVAVTVLDSSEINFTIDGQEITADIKADSIGASKLSPAVVASLALADSASQPGHSHTASDISDFATEVENNVEVLANTAARHSHSNKTILDNIQEALTSVLKSNYDSAYTHISNTGNPHNVTANQVGLSNVDNTSDLNKPISTATQSALDGKSATSHNHNLNDLTEKSYNSLTDKPTLGTAAALNSGTSSGNVPVLDGSGKLDIGLLPGIALTDTFVVASEAAMLALSAQTGDVAVRSDVNKSFILKGSSASTLGDWQELLTPTDNVHSIFGRQGTVTAQTNDYTWAQINKATSSIADITTRSYNDLQNLPTLGTLASQNGTFSGGGTLATGGFTLTVPATGTAALLATANTFTADQTVPFLRISGASGAVTANTLDGSDTSIVSLAGGGGVSSSRGAYVNAFGNEYSAIPAFAGNFIFEAGNVSTGHIRFFTGGTQQMHIGNNGNVGIGTTSPGDKLHLIDTAGYRGLTIENRLVGNQGGYVRFLKNRNGAAPNANDYVAGFEGRVGTTSSSVSVGAFSLQATNTTAGSERGFLSFSVRDGATFRADAVVINHLGNVGIGTTSPGERLDVFGGGRFSAGAPTTHGSALIYSGSSLGPHIVGNTDTSGNSTITASAMRAQFGGLGFKVAYSPSTTAGAARTFTDAFIVTTTGNVGIGTTAPASKFDAVVDGNGGIFRRYGGSPSMQFARANGTLASPTQVNSATTIGAFGATALDNTSVYRTVAVIRFNSEGAVTSTSAAGSVTIQTTPSGSVTAVDRLVVNSSGNVGIGTTSPTGELHIDQASTTGAIPTLILDQADVSEEFIEFVSTSAANNTNPISTTAVGTYAGKLRINVNGTYYWLPYYNP